MTTIPPTLDQLIFNFNITSATFQTLVGVVGNWGVVSPDGDIHQHMLLTLWFLSTDESFDEIAERFSLPLASVSQAVNRILSSFNTNSSEFITWSTMGQCHETAAAFSDKCTIPGIVAAIGMFHVTVPKLGENGYFYQNRLQFHSVSVQLGVRNDKKILSVCGCFPGRLTDFEVFSKSSLFELGQEGMLCMDHTHIIGSSAYPLTPWMLVPYSDASSPQQKNYNMKLTEALHVVQETIDLVKGRFPRLHFIEMKNEDTIRHSVVTACVIHNICLELQDKKDFTVATDRLQPITRQEYQPTPEAEIKRNQIAESIYQYS